MNFKICILRSNQGQQVRRSTSRVVVSAKKSDRRAVFCQFIKNDLIVLHKIVYYF
jgi:hypothetical protein